MKNDPIWRAFRETGDPVYYLLYKSADVKFGSGAEKGGRNTEAREPAASPGD